MKGFLARAFLFVIPVIIWAGIEGAMPLSMFTHRPWEALLFQTKFGDGKTFYPETTLKMTAVGDLCHHTDKAVLREEIWVTDKIGYRNNTYINDADVLFIGDSFIVGSGLNQENTITNQVRDNLGSDIKVYNISPGNLSAFDKLLKKGILKKPKVIIYSVVERTLPEPIKYYNDDKENKGPNLNHWFFVNPKTNIYLDKITRQYSAKWATARLFRVKGSGVQGVDHSQMHFFNGPKQTYDKKNLAKTVKILSSYKAYCDSLGTGFLFLPSPNKETVYYELVPFKTQPEYLFALDSLLKENKINSVNTLKVYNSFRKENKQLLYHYDDTHWNANGTKLIAKEIVKKLKSDFNIRPE